MVVILDIVDILEVVQVRQITVRQHLFGLDEVVEFERPATIDAIKFHVQAKLWE